jgi:hypothetical protein
MPFPAFLGYLYAEVEYNIKDVLVNVSASKDLVLPRVSTNPARFSVACSVISSPRRSMPEIFSLLSSRASIFQATHIFVHSIDW